MKWIQRKQKAKPNENDLIEEQIASIRGIKDLQAFLNPTTDELHDPYLMKNIETASNRIIMAIAKDEKIVISCDPDADGITAKTIMHRYLNNYTDKVDYIYAERNDGHGITEMIKTDSLSEKDTERLERSKSNIEKIMSADLLILIDSSSNDALTCELIKNNGIDIIVLDHHAIEKPNPHVILVNPQQDGCEYPNKHLSGAGVVFKTMEVMEDTLGQVDIWQYIDLVAVGMYGDMMRVDIPENRYLIMNGLRNMKNPGLVRILKGGKADLYKLSGDSIGFTIAPMLNGVTRMGDIRLAIDILIEDDDKVCMKLRLKMAKLNDLRKAKQKEIAEQYMLNIDDSKKVLIVMDEQSSKGFNGLVAQQLTDKYKRPVIVGRIHKGELSGSFRSFNNFKFKKFLQGFDGEIEAMGHEGAGGITINIDELPNLETYFEYHMPSLEDTSPTIMYDLEVDVKKIGESIKGMERINLLTGSGFPKVNIRVNGITVESTECIGKTQETVKVSTLDEVQLIKFKVSDQYASELDFFDTVDVVGQLSMNEFYNFQLREKICTPQIMLEDYKSV